MSWRDAKNIMELVVFVLLMFAIGLVVGRIWLGPWDF